MDAVERRLLDGDQILRILAELGVGARFAQGVVVLDRLHERRRILADLHRQLLERVGLERAHLVGKHALALDVLLGHVHAQALGVDQLALPVGGVGHVVRVEDLGIPAGVLAVRQIVVQQAHLHGLVDETLAGVVGHRQKRHVAHGSRAGVEVVQHLGMADVLHGRANPHAHLVAVAGLIVLLALEVVQVGDVVVHHLVVIGIVTRRDDHAILGVDLHIFAIFTLSDRTGDRTGLVGDQLARRRGIADIHAFCGRHLRQRLHGIAGGEGLGAEESRDVVQFETVDVERGGLLAIAVIGHGAVDGLDAVDAPVQRLAGIVGPVADQLAMRAVLVRLHHQRDQVLDARLIALVKVQACRGIAVRHGRTLLLQQYHLRTVFRRGQRRRGACRTGADDQHVAFDGFGDLCDRLGRLHERRQPVGGRGAVARNADSTVGIRRVLLVAARGKRAGAQRAQRGNAAKLQEITARRGPSLCFHSFSPLQRTFLSPACVREFRHPEKPLAKPKSTLRAPGVPR